MAGARGARRHRAGRHPAERERHGRAVPLGLEDSAPAPLVGNVRGRGLESARAGARPRHQNRRRRRPSPSWSTPARWYPARQGAGSTRTPPNQASDVLTAGDVDFALEVLDEALARVERGA
jgi:hypothetical protein